MSGRRFDPAVPEQMDRPQPVSAALRDDLRNLERLNRHFGGHGLVCRRLAPLWRRGARYRLLDMATGFGDIPRRVADAARRRGVALEIDAVDFQPSTLALAREASGGYPEIRFIEGDVLAFRAGRPYDVVLCTLALHHFSEADAVGLLARLAEMSSGRVLVSDLERSRFARWGVWLLTATLFRHPMTRHDARLSVERAFSFRELRALAVRAGWRAFEHRREFPARQSLWLDRAR